MCDVWFWQFLQLEETSSRKHKLQITMKKNYYNFFIARRVKKKQYLIVPDKEKKFEILSELSKDFTLIIFRNLLLLLYISAEKD